jgi:hypothetical protein
MASALHSRCRLLITLSPFCRLLITLPPSHHAAAFLPPSHHAAAFLITLSTPPFSLLLLFFFPKENIL